MRINNRVETDRIARSIEEPRINNLYHTLADLTDEMEGWTHCLVDFDQRLTTAGVGASRRFAYRPVDFDQYPSLFALSTTERDAEPPVKTVVGVAPLPDSTYHIIPFTLQGHETSVAILDTRKDGIVEESVTVWRPEPNQATLLKLGVVPTPETTLADAVERVRHYCEIVG